MRKVFVVGSLNMDVIIRVARHPRVGETVFSRNIEKLPGGKGLNQAVASARQGAETHLIGRVGDDSFGQSLFAFANEQEVSTRLVRRVSDEPTGQAFVTVDENGENTIIVNWGANKVWDTFADDLPDIGAGDVVLAQLETPAEIVASVFETAQKHAAVTVLNPSPIELFVPELLSVTDVLIVNETELAQTDAKCGGQGTPSAEGIVAKGCKSVIATLGAKGATVYNDGVWSLVPGRTVKAVDTTGAGDCFAGTVAAAMSNGMTLSDAAVRGNIAASLSVTRRGAAPSIPDADEVDAILSG